MFLVKTTHFTDYAPLKVKRGTGQWRLSKEKRTVNKALVVGAAGRKS